MSSSGLEATSDEEQRAAALDPVRSFIVEAPAGSGKTELLIQRFLMLLARVERPEQVVAITFTRKAAAEMRQRVSEALRAAASEQASVAPHRLITLEIAAAVLEQSRRRGWSLLEHAQSLRIMTIDALNGELAQQMPVLADGIGGAALTDSAEGHYRRAARRTIECIADRNPLGEGLRELLAAADNSLTRLEFWLTGLLPQRDRWIRAMSAGSDGSLAAVVEDAWQRLRRDRLERLRSLAGQANEKLLIEILSHLNDTEGQPDDIEAFAEWRRGAQLLLTLQGSWRRQFTRREGFGPQDGELKARVCELRDRLTDIDGLRDALSDLAAFDRIDPTQLRLLGAVQAILPHLLAELRVIFAERETVDHTELALAAQRALGAVDAPSDLLLALDHRIEHILVDEFQDTSHLQWELLELLTAGWEPGDGRTLFLVGDPLQSIYRFRDADLSLFLRAKQQGLGSIVLDRIELHRNHRSHRELVDWVNGSFAEIFPTEDQVEAGRPRFRSATTDRVADAQAGVELHWLMNGNPADEIERIVEVVGREAQEPGRSTGILVRSRAHLKGVRAALAAAGYPAHAVEIDSIVDTQIGQDLIALVSALLHHGDRLAWLGLLRCANVGIAWADLHALCAGPEDPGIWERLHDADSLSRLSADARQRAERLRERLAIGMARRGEQSLGSWLRDCWLLTDGPAAISDPADLRLAEQFFVDIEARAQDGDLDDPASLWEEMAAPGAAAEVPLESGIEIMTVHRAKGLEFDTVILPGLSRKTGGSKYNLLLSNDFYLSTGESVRLFAATVGNDSLQACLRAMDREHASAEEARLLYVAATRARQRLHLIASIDSERGRPDGGSLLATLWPAIEPPAAIEESARSAQAASPTPEFLDLRLRRLRIDAGHELPAVFDAARGSPTSVPEFEWVHPASVQVGTLIHRELQRLADKAAEAGHPEPPQTDPNRYARELELLGVERDDLGDAAARVAAALDKVWADPTGRWILHPWPEAWSELELTVRAAERLEHLRLDRSFVDDEDRRWIIDYKTGRHLGSDIEGFLDSEVERYRPQLERYARAIAAIDDRPIRVGLYFPLMSCLRDWQPAGI